MKHPTSITTIGAFLLATGCATVQEPWNGQTFAQGTPQTPNQISGNPWTASTSPSSELDLVAILVNRLGVNSQQALGGAGSIFALAQQRMKPDDFMQLSSSVPSMDRYLSSVPQPKSSISWLSSEAELRDGKTNDLGNLAALTGSFQTLGMNESMINKFVPVVLQYVQEQSGPTAMSLLQSALYRF